MPTDLPSKRCSRCERQLPLCEFGRNGKQRWCRECKSDWVRLRRAGITWHCTSKSYPGGKVIEVRSPYEAWTKWAVDTLTKAAEEEVIRRESHKA